MASPGLLFLLLMSSSLLLSVSTSPDQNQLEEEKKFNKAKEGAKATAKFILNTIDEIRTVAVPFLGLIPVFGTAISVALTLALVGVSVISKKLNDKKMLYSLISEFESLNSKLDEYRVGQKWDTWASGAYH